MRLLGADTGKGAPTTEAKPPASPPSSSKTEPANPTGEQTEEQKEEKTQEEKARQETVRQAIHDNAALTAPYLIMNALAAVVACYGLLENSTLRSSSAP